MTTGEFIKMLQEEDPSGETHMRFPHGEPWFVESKAGYYDGPYSYFDEDGNYIYTTTGSKIDIYVKDLDDWVEEIVGNSLEMPFEEITKRMKFDFSNMGNEELKQQRIDSKIKIAKEAYDNQIEMNNRHFKEYHDKIKERYNKGERFFQDKRVDEDQQGFNEHFYYSWITLYPDGKRETRSNVATTWPILESEQFEKLDNNFIEGFYEWVLKTDDKDETI